MAKTRIEDFLSKGAKPDRVEQFEKLSVGKPKEEVRILEMEMLEPEPVPEYIGEVMRYVMNSEHTVKFVFRNQEEMEFFGKFIPIAKYQENSITDIKIILDLFHAIEAGEVSYNKGNGRFSIVAKENEIEQKPSAPGRKLLRR
jgi:hypothetical protein